MRPVSCRNRWDEGIDVVVEGDAVQTTDDDVLERLAGAWAAKCDGRWQYEVREGGFYHPEGGAVLVFSISPDKVLAFASGKFSQTRPDSSPILVSGGWMVPGCRAP